MHFGLIYLAGRIIGMGLERPLVKRLAVGRDPSAATTLYVGLGELFFAAIIAFQALRQPGYFDGLLAWLPLALIPGLLYAVSFHTFIRAMRVGEVSLLTPLFATGFIMMYAYDVAAGFQPLSWLPLSGVLLVSVGVGFLHPAHEMDWRRLLNLGWVLKQPGAVLMLLNAFSVATGRFIDKTLAPTAPPELYALVVNAPAVLIGLALLSARRNLTALPKLLGERLGIAVALVFFGQGAFLLLLFSLDYFPPSVVEPVTQLGVFIAIAFGGLWFGEPVRARWLPSAMVVAGAVLLLV